MKKIYKMAGLTCLGLLLSTQNSNAQVADFENLTIQPDTFWDGSDMSGTHNAGTFTSIFTSGDFTFPNVFDTTWGAPGYWLSGFAYSNMTDSVTSGVGNKYSSRAGGGENSSNYAVSQNNSSFIINNISGFNAIQFSITNSTYAYNSMRDGDAFAKKFGGVSGNDPDWFKLNVTAFSQGIICDSTEIYLADFRFTNNAQDYILKNWSNISILSMCSIDSVYFELSSSDVGAFGMNTPGFFCIDNISMAIWDGIDELKNELTINIYPNPASSLLNISASKNIEAVHVMDVNGRTVMNISNNNSNQLKINVERLKSGVYFIQIISNGTSQVQKFIKQ